MGRVAWLVVAALASGTIAHAQPAPAGEDGPGPEAALTQRIAVWRIDALGIQAELVARLETLFRMELDRLASRPLPSRREIERAIGQDAAVRDCAGEDRCLIAVGKKVKVDVVVTGSVAALGESYILNIKAVDVVTGKQIRRIATDPLRGSPDELIEAIRVAAYRLLAPEQLHGSVIVLSDLVGASVTIDGKGFGRTPMVSPASHLPLGKHALKVEAPGYVPFEETVDVRFQKSTRVVVRLVTREAAGLPDGPVRTVQKDRPWYSKPWAYAAIGGAAILVGAAIGYGLAKDHVIDCSESDSEACQ
jgi:hypothetical protein